MYMMYIREIFFAWKDAKLWISNSRTKVYFKLSSKLYLFMSWPKNCHLKSLLVVTYQNKYKRILIKSILNGRFIFSFITTWMSRVFAENYNAEKNYRSKIHVSAYFSFSYVHTDVNTFSWNISCTKRKIFPYLQLL